MHSLPEEFLVLSRQLGQAQRRCSETLVAQAAQIERLQAEVVRLRAAVVVRDTRLSILREELDQQRAAVPGGARRQAMARHIRALVERIATLSRECLRWRLAAEHPHRPVQGLAVPVGCSAPTAAASTRAYASTAGAVAESMGTRPEVVGRDASAASLAAADLVICQTGCVSHDDYWRMQDHCRRTGKVCVLVDQSLAARQADVLASFVLPLASTAQSTPGRLPTGLGEEILIKKGPTRLLSLEGQLSIE